MKPLTDLELVRAWLRLGIDAHTQRVFCMDETWRLEVVAHGGTVVGRVGLEDVDTLVKEFPTTGGRLMADLRSFHRLHTFTMPNPAKPPPPTV